MFWTYPFMKLVCSWCSCQFHAACLWISPQSSNSSVAWDMQAVVAVGPVDAAVARPGSKEPMGSSGCVSIRIKIKIQIYDDLWLETNIIYHDMTWMRIGLTITNFSKPILPIYHYQYVYLDTCIYIYMYFVHSPWLPIHHKESAFLATFPATAFAGAGVPLLLPSRRNNVPVLLPRWASGGQGQAPAVGFWSTLNHTRMENQCASTS